MKSVVVFDIDGLSIRAAGCYGNVETSTPLLNEFAAQSLVFEQHYRAFVDSRRDRDAAIGSLVSMLEVDCSPLLLCDVETTSEYETTRFDGVDELTNALEEHFDSEDSVAWVRVGHAAGEVEDRFPLALVAGLVEAGVAVAVTSCTPLLEDEALTIDHEESIRVPFMLWSPEASRVQQVTTSSALDEVLLGDTEALNGVLIRSDRAIALREPEAMLVVTDECRSALEEIEPGRLGDCIDVTDKGLRLFRKPDDVWNVHNVLVEDVNLAIEMFSRLRSLL